MRLACVVLPGRSESANNPRASGNSLFSIFDTFGFRTGHISNFKHFKPPPESNPDFPGSARSITYSEEYLYKAGCSERGAGALYGRPFLPYSLLLVGNPETKENGSKKLPGKSQVSIKPFTSYNPAPAPLSLLLRKTFGYAHRWDLLLSE